MFSETRYALNGDVRVAYRASRGGSCPSIRGWVGAMTSSPRTLALMLPLVGVSDARAVLPTIRVPTLVLHHTDDPFIPPAKGEYIAEHIPDAKYAELPGRNRLLFVEPWRASFQEIAEFLTGQQAQVPDDRVLATVLFTDIVDSTRQAATLGDRDWHALLGSGLEFADRGTHQLKGVPGEWQLFAVAPSQDRLRPA